MSCTYYFAYGSNMNPSQMEKRMSDGPKMMLKKHLWPIDQPLTLEKVTALGKATLNNFTLSFSKRSSGFPIEGYATVSPHPVDFVEGVVYQLNDLHIKVLDFYEGVELNHYYKTMVKVMSPEGLESDVLIYIAHPSKIDMKCRPSEKYLQTILEGAQQFNLSHVTVQKLKLCGKKHPAASAAKTTMSTPVVSTKISFLKKKLFETFLS